MFPDFDDYYSSFESSVCVCVCVCVFVCPSWHFFPVLLFIMLIMVSDGMCDTVVLPVSVLAWGPQHHHTLRHRQGPCGECPGSLLQINITISNQVTRWQSAEMSDFNLPPFLPPLSLSVPELCSLGRQRWFLNTLTTQTSR